MKCEPYNLVPRLNLGTKKQGSALIRAILCYQEKHGFEFTFKMKILYKYELIIYWHPEDQVFIAEVPELPGCLAHGNTQEAALKNIKEAMQLWLDTAQEFGDPIPKPKGKRLTEVL